MVKRLDESNGSVLSWNKIYPEIQWMVFYKGRWWFIGSTNMLNLYLEGNKNRDYEISWHQIDVLKPFFESYIYAIHDLNKQYSDGIDGLKEFYDEWVNNLSEFEPPVDFDSDMYYHSRKDFLPKCFSY